MENRRIIDSALNAEMTLTKINDHEYKLNAAFVKYPNTERPEWGSGETWHAIFDLYVNDNGTVRINHGGVLTKSALGDNLSDAIKQAAQAGRLWQNSSDSNYLVPVNPKTSRVIFANAKDVNSRNTNPKGRE